MYRAYYVLGTALVRTWEIVTHLIVITSLESKYYCYPYFMDGENKPQEN